MNIGGVEIKYVADTMAKHMQIQFKARNGYIW
jgi:hypothetical protein